MKVAVLLPTELRAVQLYWPASASSVLQISRMDVVKKSPPSIETSS